MNPTDRTGSPAERRKRHIAALRQRIGDADHVCLYQRELCDDTVRTVEFVRRRLRRLAAAGALTHAECACDAKARRHVRISLCPGPGAVPRRIGKHVYEIPKETLRARHMAALRLFVGDREHACVRLGDLILEAGVTRQAMHLRLRSLAKAGLIARAPCDCNALRGRHLRIQIAAPTSPRTVPKAVTPAPAGAAPARPRDNRTMAGVLTVWRAMLDGQDHACTTAAEFAQACGLVAHRTRARLSVLESDGVVRVESCLCDARPEAHLRLKRPLVGDALRAPDPLVHFRWNDLEPHRAALLARLHAMIGTQGHVCLRPLDLVDGGSDLSGRAQKVASRDAARELRTFAWTGRISRDMCHCPAAGAAHLRIRITDGSRPAAAAPAPVSSPGPFEGVPASHARGPAARVSASVTPQVLDVLRRYPDREMTVADLEAEVRTCSEATLWRVLRRLLAAGLVERTLDPGDQTHYWAIARDDGR